MVAWCANLAMTNRFLRLLDKKPVLLIDGATGTNLFAMGLQSGDSPEFWNIDHPDRIAKHYRSFIDAGSDIVLTNSFGGTTYRLKLHEAQDRVVEFNRAAARILCEQVADSGRDVVVAGSMGPTGEILEPAGTVSIEQAETAYAEQAHALKEGGADVLWIETLSSLEEAEAAVSAAAQTGLPIVLTLSIDTNGRTMMGVTPSDIVKLQDKLSTPITAYGTNCGLGASEVIAAIINMRSVALADGRDNILVAKGNCGIPQWNGGEICYSGTPELMATYATMAIDAGARIVGGCCGTTPEHVAAMRTAIDNHNGDSPASIEEIESVLGEISAGAKAQMRGDLSVAGGSVSGSRDKPARRRRR